MAGRGQQEPQACLPTGKGGPASRGWWGGGRLAAVSSTEPGPGHWFEIRETRSQAPEDGSLCLSHPGRRQPAQASWPCTGPVTLLRLQDMGLATVDSPLSFPGLMPVCVAVGICTCPGVVHLCVQAGEGECMRSVAGTCPPSGSK